MRNTQTYEAIYQCADAEGQTRQGFILFSAIDFDDAALSFDRWWKNRIKNVPEIFAILYAVTIYQIQPKAIEDDGYLPPYRHQFSNIEWKYDYGYPFAQIIRKAKAT